MREHATAVGKSKNQRAGAGALCHVQIVEVIFHGVEILRGVHREASVAAVGTDCHIKIAAKSFPELGGHKQSALVIHFCGISAGHLCSPPTPELHFATILHHEHSIIPS